MQIGIRISPPDCPYDKRHGFREDAPMEEDLVECYIQKHYPKGFFIVEHIQMPCTIKTPNTKVWFEYSIFGPAESLESGVALFKKIQARESKCEPERYASMAFNDGIRVYPRD